MRSFRLPAIVLLIIGSVALGLWAARRPLSEAAVSQWLAGQGVDARYRVTAISPDAVTLADVSLGPAGRPDFTAERVDAKLGWSPLRPRIDAVTLVRPRLRATLTERGISFGAVDKLLPAPAATPQPLPDIDVTIVGGSVFAATPAGPLAGTLDGRGRLRDGFRGFGSVSPAALALAGCTATLAETRYAVAMRRDDVGVTAAGSSPRLACAAATAERVGWRLAATLPPTLDRYAAQLQATTGRVTASNARADGMTLAADGTAATLGGPVAGKLDATLTGASVAALRARTAKLDGSYRFDPATGFANGDGLVSVAGAATALPAAPLRDAARSVRGTLAAPLLDRLITRGNAAARSFDASARVVAALDRAGPRATVTALDARATSGTRLVQTGTLELARDLANWAGGFALDGGGLPATTLSGQGQWRGGSFGGGGQLTMARFAVPGAVLHALRLDAQGDGGIVRLDGGVRVSGALGGGVVAQRLGLPVDLAIQSGGFRFGTRCLALDWTALSQGTLRTEPGRARICPTGGEVVTLAGDRLSGGGTVAPLLLRGVSGTEPLTLATSALRLALAGTTAHPVLTLAPVRVDLGYGARRMRATVAGRLDLAATAGSGRIDSASLTDPASPVNIDAAAGAWRLAGRRLDLNGGVARITDRTAPVRFQPLRIAGLTASLGGGRVTARGEGAVASNGARLFGFTAAHDLASGTGHADVDTGVLTFGPALQPYEITESLRGVVDNVRGPVSGTGRIDWTGDRIASRGTARIDHVSLATAALGPVDDIAGTLVFDDLLAMTTPPGQTLTIKRINPGVAVDDGVAVFRMLGPDAAEIASMVWPYAGGTLTLAPVTIRAADARRDFVLTVDNLDAEQFLQKFEIKNLNVTGRFDGRLPLVFEGTKGRIDGGRLVARPGGGLVQYVGEVGASDMGAGAKLAFDALRRLRYKNLALDFDGDLDGELVTQLRFAGTNEAATTLGGGPLPIRATGLPFKFNVTVRAPFRALLGTASSFSDVRPLIRPAADGVQPR